jgi:tetrahydromethanopterin S-methyltransferase subunit G
MTSDEKAAGNEAIRKRIADIEEQVDRLNAEKALLEETIERVEAEE